MAIYLYRLGHWAATHAWRVIAAWALTLGLLAALAASFGSTPTSRVEIPNAKFQSVMDHLEKRVPQVSGNVGTGIVVTDNGQPFTPQQQQAVAKVIATWEETPHVTMVADPFAAQSQLDSAPAKLAAGQRKLDAGKAKAADGAKQLKAGWESLRKLEIQLRAAEVTAPGSAQTTALRQQVKQLRDALSDGQWIFGDGERQLNQGQAQLDRARASLSNAEGIRFVSEDGSAALIQIGFDLDPQSLDPADRAKIPEAAASLSKVGVTASFGGEITQEMEVVGIAEVIGLITAGIVLLITLGSLVAAGLPLVVSLLGVAVGLAAAVASSYFFSMHQMTPALALMIGLAVGIDYMLFIITRHRAQLLGGMGVAESVGRAVGTAGNAVVFAGATVVVALAALLISGMPFLSTMGLVAAGSVVSAVLMSITLGPALLGLLGTRVISQGAWAVAELKRRDQLERLEEQVDAWADDDRVDEVVGGWFVNLITARPWLTVAAVVAITGLMSIPVAQLRLGLPDGSNEAPDSSAYAAYQSIAQKFGPGMNGPLLVTADLPAGATKADAELAGFRVGERLSQIKGVDSVLQVATSPDNRTLAYQVVPATGPSDARTDATVHRMLAAADEIGTYTNTQLGLTGRTVATIEISERMGQALPPYLAVVVGLSLLILIGVFRSVVVPVIATVGFLLSVGAAFGATVAVFQWGWLGGLFGVHEPGPLMSFGPIMLIGVLFGLAMDYQMFLVSGMREAWAHGEEAKRAVKTGFMHGAKVVTAAAAIMFAVFGGFVFSHLAMIKPIGFGLAMGVAIDAVLVRMTLTPAVMTLLGEKAWWIPAWLDRILPDLDVEGAKLSQRLAEWEASEAEAGVQHRELVSH